MSAPSPPPDRHLPMIDAMRGVAVLGVIIVHAEDLYPFIEGALRKLVAQGGFGVQLFFVLSALTLLMSWRGRQDPDPTPAFLVRRFFRVVPMFWAALLGYALLDGRTPHAYAPDGVGPWQWALTALFLHGWHPAAINAVVPGGWSIGAEVTFYLMFPFLAAAVTSLRRAIALLVAACLAGGLATWGMWLAAAVEPGDPRAYLLKSFLLWWAPAQWPVFAIGFVVFFAVCRPDGGPPAPRPRLGAMLVGAALLAALALPWAPVPGGGNLLYLPYAAVAGVAVAGLLLAPGLPVAPRWLVHVGRVSYSAYFLHFVVIRLTAGPWQRVYAGDATGWHYMAGFFGYAGLVVGLTVAAATVTYRWIERPGIALGRRVLAAWGLAGRGAG